MELLFGFQKNYNPDSIPTKSTWTQLSTIDPMTNAANWNMSNAGDISLKVIKGKKVNIAFVYKSTDSQELGKLRISL